MSPPHYVTATMVGKKYGHISVLGIAPRKGRAYPYVFVECDCGWNGEMAAYQIRQRVSRCVGCAKQDRIRHGKDVLSVTLPSGRTVAQLADAHGLKVDTVYHRWIRGWPEKDLTRPASPYRRRAS